VFIAWGSCSYVAESWSIAESSADPGGLPAVYLLKTLIPIMAISLVLQGVAEILRNLLILINPQPAFPHTQDVEGQGQTESNRIG
jgi:TRAP-type mannitol/chloroaromatic compound transport system permease small subunit